MVRDLTVEYGKTAEEKMEDGRQKTKDKRQKTEHCESFYKNTRRKKKERKIDEASERDTEW